MPAFHLVEYVPPHNSVKAYFSRRFQNLSTQWSAVLRTTIHTSLFTNQFQRQGTARGSFKPRRRSGSSAHSVICSRQVQESVFVLRALKKPNRISLCNVTIIVWYAKCVNFVSRFESTLKSGAFSIAVIALFIPALF